MPILKFRVFWEEDDQIYRDVELRTDQTFLDFHKIILKAYDFDGKHSASFWESNDRWQHLREINSEVLVNKKDAQSLSMMRTPVSALIAKPDQHFMYEYDPAKQWTFQVELIGISKEEDEKETYPRVLRKEGIGPVQYGYKGAGRDKMMEIEEKYDLGSDEMAEGFSSEGEGGGEAISGGDGFEE